MAVMISALGLSIFLGRSHVGEADHHFPLSEPLTRSFVADGILNQVTNAEQEGRQLARGGSSDPKSSRWSAGVLIDSRRPNTICIIKQQDLP